MTLDERVRSSVVKLAAEIDARSPMEVDRIKRRGRRRRTMKRTAWVSIGVVFFVGFAALAVPIDPNSIDPATTSDVDTVEIADLAVTVDSPSPTLSAPPVWIGAQSPEPGFDTSGLGPEIPFEPGRPSVGDLPDDVTRAVYLGDLEGEPFYVYAAKAPSIFDWFSEIIFGNFSGQVLGTSLNCCSGGDMDQNEGLPGLGYSLTNGEFDSGRAEWLGLGPDVAAIAYEIDGESYGWQRPVGGVSSVAIDAPPTSYSMVAYDAAGEVVGRFEPPPRPPGLGIGLAPGEEVLRSEPFLVVTGPDAPEPEFDTSELGTETPLTPVEDLDGLIEDLRSLWAPGTVVKMMVAGQTPNGTAGFIFHIDELRPDLGQTRSRCVGSDGGAACGGDRLAEVLARGGTLPADPRSGPNYSTPGPTDLTWETPEGTSVVTLRVGDRIWWQRPVGGLTVFDVEVEPGERFTIIALDTAGDALASFSGPEIP